MLLLETGPNTSIQAGIAMGKNVCVGPLNDVGLNMSSEITHSDTGMGGPQGKKKRKRKSQGKNPDSLHNVHHDNRKSSPMQEGITILENSPTLRTNDVCSKMTSTITHSGTDLVAPLVMRKRKIKKRSKKRKSLARNDVQLNLNPKSTLVEGITVPKNSCASPTNDVSERTPSGTDLVAPLVMRKRRIKKRSKKRKSLARNDVQLNLNPKSTLVEGITVPKNSCASPTNDVSERTPAGTDLGPPQAKKKKNRGKNTESLSNPRFTPQMEGIMVQRHVCMPDTGLGAPKARKKRKRKNPVKFPNSLASRNDVHQESQKYTPLQGSTMRDDACTSPTDDVCSKTSSGIPHSDNGLGAPKAKKKRKRKNPLKIPDFITSSNNIHQQSPKCTTVQEDGTMQINACTLPTNDVCSKMSSKITPSGSGLAAPQVKKKKVSKRQRRKLKLLKSNGVQYDDNIGGPTTADTKNILDLKLKSISEVAKQYDKVGMEQMASIDGDPSGQNPLNGPIGQKASDDPSDQKPLNEPIGRATFTSCFRKKLLILDVNGMLADIVPRVRGISKADKVIGMKAVFKRPFCDDFLQFCFERFNVGVWSSRTKKNLNMIIDFLLGNSRSNLVFCWDQSHCTQTGFKTLENREKPLVLKELIKLWENRGPWLPWERGDYNESNTLLLDDSPYKALRNPPNTAIFPYSYQFNNKKDNSLGPGGDLRVYLEGLAVAENVQKYVEQNPYGQKPITESNKSWAFYSKVMGPKSFKQQDYTHSGLEHATVEQNSRIAIQESKQTTNKASLTRKMPYPENLVQTKQFQLIIHQNAEQLSEGKLGKVKNGSDDKCFQDPPTEPMEGKRQLMKDPTPSFLEGKFCKEEKGFAGTCGQDPPAEPLEKKRRLMKDQIPMLSEVDAINGNGARISNKEIHPPQILPSILRRDITVSSKRKLLVLDVNVLLADIISDVPDGPISDSKIGKKGVLKRPFCDDFLRFCFERFSVGFWSATPKENVPFNLDFLMGSTDENLLFCWDISKCLETGFGIVGDKYKPIILKELTRLWEKHEPHLPWKMDEFNESNTLLLDNYPSTALLNPPHTAIFPPRCQYKDERDTSLGPGGDLRVYLEGLASAENVQDYVKQNPFGQRPITEKNISWNYYLKVIGSVMSQK